MNKPNSETSWFNIRLETNTPIPCKLKNKKATKAIGLYRKLQHILPRTSLLVIYMLFIKPHLDFGDVVYDQPSNNAFSKKIETVQYNAALAIMGAKKGTFRKKLSRTGVRISSRKKVDEMPFNI